MHGGRRFRLGLLALVAGVAFFGLLVVLAAFFYFTK